MGWQVLYVHHAQALSPAYIYYFFLKHGRVGWQMLGNMMVRSYDP